MTFCKSCTVWGRRPDVEACSLLRDRLKFGVVSGTFRLFSSSFVASSSTAFDCSCFVLDGCSRTVTYFQQENASEICRLLRMEPQQSMEPCLLDLIVEIQEQYFLVSKPLVASYLNGSHSRAHSWTNMKPCNFTMSPQRPHTYTVIP